MPLGKDSGNIGASSNSVSKYVFFVVVVVEKSGIQSLGLWDRDRLVRLKLSSVSPEAKPTGSRKNMKESRRISG